MHSDDIQYLRQSMMPALLEESLPIVCAKSIKAYPRLKVKCGW